MAERSYRLTVEGELSDIVGESFEGMALTRAGGNTSLTTPVRDQPELQGLLQRVSALGLVLLEARAIDDRPMAPGRESDLPTRVPQTRSAGRQEELTMTTVTRGNGVAPASSTETYAALRLEIDNWRWSGVPFFIRTGKRLPVMQTELRLVFKHAPQLGFAALERRPEPNQLVIRLDPSTGDSRRRADPGAGLVYWSVTDTSGRPAAPFRPGIDWWKAVTT